MTLRGYLPGALVVLTLMSGCSSSERQGVVQTDRDLGERIPAQSLDRRRWSPNPDLADVCVDMMERYLEQASEVVEKGIAEGEQFDMLWPKVLPPLESAYKAGETRTRILEGKEGIFRR